MKETRRVFLLILTPRGTLRKMVHTLPSMQSRPMGTTPIRLAGKIMTNTAAEYRVVHDRVFLDLGECGTYRQVNQERTGSHPYPAGKSF